MRAQQNVAFNNIGAVSTDPFNLVGGVYVVDVTSGTWGGGNAVLQRLGPDAATYLPVHTAITADGTSGAVYCAPGTYRVTITTATGNFVNVSRVPIE